MFSTKRTALYLALSAMAFAGGEASATTTRVCKYVPNPPGSQVCVTYTTGSEVCTVDSGADPLNPPATTAPALTSVTCSITGANFIDGAEGGHAATGAYCASGAPPPGTCESGSVNIAAFSTSSTLSAKPAAAKPAKAAKPKECKPPKPPPHAKGKPPHPPKHSCGDIIVPSGEETFTADGTATIDCDTDTNGDEVCTARAEIFPPDGATCPNGEPATDFTADEMLAITEICVAGSGGDECGTIYAFCTLAGSGYDCIDISDQGTRGCGFSGNPRTFDPDDPLCGAQRGSSCD